MENDVVPGFLPVCTETDKFLVCQYGDIERLHNRATYERITPLVVWIIAVKTRKLKAIASLVTGRRWRINRNEFGTEIPVQVFHVGARGHNHFVNIASLLTQPTLPAKQFPAEFSNPRTGKDPLCHESVLKKEHFATEGLAKLDPDSGILVNELVDAFVYIVDVAVVIDDHDAALI